jgi:hypothetical protein
MRERVLAAVAAAALSLGSAGANAALVTTAPAGGTVIDFSQFGGCAFAAAGCTASDLPDVGGLVGESVIFSGTGGFGGASLYNGVSNGVFGLGTNGRWGAGRNSYAANNGGSSSMTFTFVDGPVSSVGAFVNYAPGGTPTLEVLGAGMVVLESYDIAALAPISTPGAVDDGAFRGISRASSDIYAVRWSNSFSVLDDLAFNRVPEPGTLALLVLSLAGLAATRRRKQ